MKRARLLLIILAGLALGLAAYIAWPDPVIAPELSRYAGNWPLPNHDYDNSRATVDSSINSASVNRLRAAWSFPLEPGAGLAGALGSPVIQGEKVYVQDSKSNIYALDFISGNLLWKSLMGQSLAFPGTPAVARNRLFLARGAQNVRALDMKGRELWDYQLPESDSGIISSPPLEYDGLVYFSTSPGSATGGAFTPGVMGTVYALDYKTGQLKWSFNMNEGSKLWGNPAVNSGGGSRFAPAIDHDSGIMYWGTGSPGPWPGSPEYPDATSRPSPNLYANSLLALDHRSGQLLWHQQVRPHDLFNLDLQTPPILIRTKTGKGFRPLLLASGKAGRVYAFEPGSGTPLWEVEVGWHQNENLKQMPPGTTRVMPGPLGGVYSPMAYRDRILYVPVVNLAASYTPDGWVRQDFDLNQGKGELLAIDTGYGKIVWSQPLDAIPLGGATLVNDLLFTSTSSGYIYAFDCQSGVKRWEYRIEGGFNAPPAVSKNTIIFPAGLGLKPRLAAFTLE